LIEGVSEAGQIAGTVLDIGSGVGALTLALLDRGATSAIAVDASTAYISAARREAAQRGRADEVRFVQADFVEASTRIPPARIVTLDRVVCCYPAYEPLLGAAVAHAEWCLALSYPRDAWYVRAGMMLDNALRRLARKSFRTFVHPVGKIEETITRAGFKLSSRRQTLAWSADVYLRQ
jgi:SAM-dependent methyltransferase